MRFDHDAMTPLEQLTHDAIFHNILKPVCVVVTATQHPKQSFKRIKKFMRDFTSESGLQGSDIKIERKGQNITLSSGDIFTCNVTKRIRQKDLEDPKEIQKVLEDLLEGEKDLGDAFVNIVGSTYQMTGGHKMVVGTKKTGFIADGFEEGPQVLEFRTKTPSEWCSRNGMLKHPKITSIIHQGRPGKSYGINEIDFRIPREDEEEQTFHGFVRANFHDNKDDKWEWIEVGTNIVKKIREDKLHGFQFELFEEDDTDMIEKVKPMQLERIRKDFEDVSCEILNEEKHLKSLLTMVPIEEEKGVCMYDHDHELRKILSDFTKATKN